MNKIVIRKLCFGILLLIVSQSPSGGDVVAHDGTILTSLLRLIAEPKEYTGKTVDVIGYYLLGQEMSGVFLSKEAADTRNIQLAIWVPVPEDKGTNNLVDNVKQGFVRVRGTFKYDEKLGSGHLGMWPGEISPVKMFKRVKP